MSLVSWIAQMIGGRSPSNHEGPYPTSDNSGSPSFPAISPVTTRGEDFWERDSDEDDSDGSEEGD